MVNIEENINKMLGEFGVHKETKKLEKGKWFEIVDKKTQKRLDLIPAKTKDDAVKKFIKRSGGHKGTITVYPVEWRK